MKLKVKAATGDILVETPVLGDSVLIQISVHNDHYETRTIDVHLEDTLGPGLSVSWINETVGGKGVWKRTYPWVALEGEHELVVNVTGQITTTVTRTFEVRERPSESPLVVVVPLAGLIGLAFAGVMTWWVLKQDTGTPEMRRISDAIKEGAEAFLRTQYKWIWLIAGAVAALFFILIFLFTANLREAWMTAVAFVLGAACSSIAGYIGMWVSIRSNIRTASAARSSLDRAIKVALRGGAVSGFAVVAMSLLGVAGIYYGYDLIGGDPRATPLLIVGFGFGASFVALFAQLGGGIYTKAADVGADLVGKVEKDIPEDDPRNAAVIADLVGDNVGDCAGRGADLFESTAAENIGAMVLGIALFPVLGINGIMFPLVARSFGLLATIAGVMVVGTREDGDPMAALNRGYVVTSVLAIAGFGLATQQMLRDAWTWYFAAGLIGILTSWAFVYITQYYTESKYRPVQDIAKSSGTGPATTIISGFAVGMECTAIPVAVVSAALFGAFKLGEMGAEGLGVSTLAGGFYGTAIATMGMLSVCAYILAMDTFGPIADNAGGITEMSRQPEEIRHKVDRLDAVGNTTKALTKGYAVGSAALAAFLLFSAYLEASHLTHISLDKVDVFIGAMLGAMLVFLFSAWAIKAVGKAAYSVIVEVRRQFKERPGIMTFEEKPDYGRAVSIVTESALKNMILPGTLAVALPIAVGFLLRAEALGGTLMVGTITGFLVALVLNNGGGAWDNAKKFVEEFGTIKAKQLRENPGLLSGLKARSPEIFEDLMRKARDSPDDMVIYGKTSDMHKAAVVGDTVGDPFKDTAGPSLHVLIKLLSTITLVLAPLFVSGM
ncbi:MAG: sodium-translocating pyrophosphatase [Euryarchaeota archaeon]|nr:sodium-translocating pyrophosphatase [Euryarchaeota archaeon]